MKPRAFLLPGATRIAGLLAAVLLLALTACRGSLPEVVMHKDPNCGCCSAWAERMREAGFTVREEVEANMTALKQSLAVPPALTSCHTARVGDYLLEGHVPPADVKRLLRERPALRGLAVPGMPVGSPGMEGSSGPGEAYAVIGFDAQGRMAVFASHP